jgi:DNA-binding transcriptional regulator YhcF (GntR family)
MRAGFTIIPDVFLEHQHDLKLDATDINILIHLARYWWEASNLPHPSKRTIAERMRIDASTVRRRIAKMEKAGTIKRRARFGSDKRREANDYDFADLIKRATPFAQGMIEKRDQKRKARSQRLTTKRTVKTSKK